jgi:MOSC domain-containing protein YiiM
MPSGQIGITNAVCKNSSPGIPKHVCTQIRLIADFGIEGDYHAGPFIRHRYLAKKNPAAPNHRQVLLADERTIREIVLCGISVLPGQLGENILLSDIGLMQLPLGTQLQIGSSIIELTEIRHPCDQLNAIHPNLLACVMPDKDDPKTYNAGMFGIVLQSGNLSAGEPVFLINK